VVLGLIFLRYLSFAFEEKRKLLEISDPHFLEDEDFYRADGVLYLPEEARWDFIKKRANQKNIGEIIDKAIEVLEDKYPK